MVDTTVVEIPTQSPMEIDGYVHPAWAIFFERIQTNLISNINTAAQLDESLQSKIDVLSGTVGNLTKIGEGGTIADSGIPAFEAESSVDELAEITEFTMLPGGQELDRVQFNVDLAILLAELNTLTEAVNTIRARLIAVGILSE